MRRERIKIADVPGKRFGNLTVVDQAARPEGGQGSYWNCKCECGGASVARLKDLRYGNTASCGCLQMPPGRKGKLTRTIEMERPWRKA